MSSNYLFHRKRDLRSYLERKKSGLQTEIERYDSNYILNVSEDDLCRSLVSKYSLEMPVIAEDKQYVVSHGDANYDRRTGTSIKIAIPFQGDGGLLEYKPSMWTSSHALFPRGEVIGQEIQVTYDVLRHDKEYLKKMRTEELDLMKRCLECSKSEVDGYNSSLPEVVRQFVVSRKKKLLDDLGLVKSLEIPVKRSDSVPETYAIPIVRRKTGIELPQVRNGRFSPEPVLNEEIYEDILEKISSMSLLMERNPETFRKLAEEDIRNHFLMVLNAHYEGKATGETFNYTGKTDILIRHEDKNVFIAECKFWEGEKKLFETIDQLLGYTSWRDTKTAILLFNKNLDFSAVLKKIDPAVKAHGCYKREYDLKSNRLKNETTFSYVLHQPGDTNRELILTIMAFTIPAQGS